MSDRITFDGRHVQEAQRYLHQMQDAISQLARDSDSQQVFCRGLLERAIAGLSAAGGGVWLLDESGAPALQHEVNLEQAGFGNNSRYQAAVQQVLESGKAALVRPEEDAAVDEQHLLLLAPLTAVGKVAGVIVVIQRPEAASAIGRGWLQFLVRLGEAAEEFFTAQALRDLRQRQQLWESMESLTRRIHRHLDTTGTAYAIANEGRNVVSCDRVSVAVLKRRKLRLAAVSGQSTFNARSEAVKELEALCQATAKMGEPLWYDGSAGDLPPQVEATLEAYLDQGYAKVVAVIPLLTPEKEPSAEEDKKASHAPRRVIGALIVESFDRAPTSDVQRARVAAVAEHASQALFNSQQHENLFLMPLWRALGKSRVVLEARNLPKTLAAAAALVLLLLALFLVPADFELEARGALQPVDQQQVFAAVDGTVHEVLVRHGEAVQAGQPLVKLRNVELQIEQERLIGERSSTLEELQGVLTSLLGGGLRPAERDQLAGRRRQLQQALESLDRQLELLNQQFEELTVRAPLAGEVITWDVRELLMHRPVQRGQVLLTVADPDSDWELEVNMPEDDMNYVNQAQQGSKEPLDVTFILASDPGVEYQGTLREVHGRAETQGEQGSSVLMQVELERDSIALLRPGATVVANVHCGRRSLGYVWLHDVWEFVQSRVLFRYF